LFQSQKREPTNMIHVVALAEVMGHREGPVAAAAVYEFAIDRFPDLAATRRERLSGATA
jgi:hypothetical protein